MLAAEAAFNVTLTGKDRLKAVRLAVSSVVKIILSIKYKHLKIIEYIWVLLSTLQPFWTTAEWPGGKQKKVRFDYGIGDKVMFQYLDTYFIVNVYK